MNGNQGEDQGFNTPPTNIGQGSSADDSGEEAAEEFNAPNETQSVQEAAAVSEVPDALSSSLGRELLEVKRAIEDRMQQNASRSASARGVGDFQAEGNIQGVAIGIGGDAGAPVSTPPGEPALTIYVAEPSSVDEVKSVVVGSMGVRAAASDDVPINVVVTGLIDAQPHRFRIRPAPGGVSVGHVKITAGTIGCLARG